MSGDGLFSSPQLLMLQTERQKLAHTRLSMRQRTVRSQPVNDSYLRLMPLNDTREVRNARHTTCFVNR
jgi:hypothetical protein